MKSGAPRFVFLEHVSDIYVAAYGRSLEEGFENAAAAMFETMTNLENVRPLLSQKVEVEGEDEKMLLYSWLEKLLVKFEVESVLLCRFKVTKLETKGGFRLEAEVSGEPYEPERHQSKVAVKAVTYHMMEIERMPAGVTLKVLFDI